MSVFSMTGFGAGRSTEGSVSVVIEIKSVNHRYLDVICKQSNRYSHLESEIVEKVKNRLKRGRVEVIVNITEDEEREYEVQLDRGLFDANFDVVKKVLQERNLLSAEAETEVALHLLQRKEVLRFVPKENDEQLSFSIIEPALQEALDNLLTMRKKEGAQLQNDLLQHLKNVKTIRKEIVKLTKSTAKDIKSKIEERLANVDAAVDPDRLAQEIAILADKADVSEELTRLDSHVAQFSQTIKDNDGGRKLEFLLQEFVREVNTIGSKTQSSEVSQLVVEAKAEVEKLREQAANVE